MKKLFKDKKGFTLVELMVVVAIMGILVAVAVPVYNNATKKAAKQTCETNCRTLESAIMQMEAVSGSKLPSGNLSFEGTITTIEDATEIDTVSKKPVVYKITDYIKAAPVCKFDDHKAATAYYYDADKGKVTHEPTTIKP